MQPDSPGPSSPDATPFLPWPALLAHWMEAARVSAALPSDGDGGRWRASIAPAMSLHALAMALGDLRRVEPAGRALALDLAEVLIRRESKALFELWSGEALPQRLMELADDALMVLELAQSCGDEWVLTIPWLQVPELNEWIEGVLRQGDRASVLVAIPGTMLFEGSPVVFCRGYTGASPPVPGVVKGFGPARQVWRQSDASGVAIRDVVAPMTAPLQAGRPLLVLAIDEGKRATPLVNPPPRPAGHLRVEHWNPSSGA